MPTNSLPSGWIHKISPPPSPRPPPAHPPKQFLCPISGKIMRNPTINETGTTYEHESLVAWYGSGSRSDPATLRSTGRVQIMIPNLVLKSLIDDWLEGEAWCPVNASGAKSPECKLGNTMKVAKTKVAKTSDHMSKNPKMETTKSMVEDTDKGIETWSASDVYDFVKLRIGDSPQWQLVAKQLYDQKIDGAMLAMMVDAEWGVQKAGLDRLTAATIARSVTALTSREKARGVRKKRIKEVTIKVGSVKNLAGAWERLSITQIEPPKPKPKPKSRFSFFSKKQKTKKSSSTRKNYFDSTHTLAPSSPSSLVRSQENEPIQFTPDSMESLENGQSLDLQNIDYSAILEEANSESLGIVEPMDETRRRLGSEEGIRSPVSNKGDTKEMLEAKGGRWVEETVGKPRQSRSQSNEDISAPAPTRQQRIGDMGYEVGYDYYWGSHGKTVDKARGQKLIIDAMNQGSLVARGECYNYGWGGLDRDESKAAFYYQISAQQGNSSAQFNLGRAYEHGQGVGKDMQKAIYWYQKSAEKANSRAQNSLGCCYRYGRAVKQDWKKAFKWFRLGALQGHSDAQSNLSYCYEHGKGTWKNWESAVMWCGRSAEQKHKGAQKDLERLFKQKFPKMGAQPEEVVNSFVSANTGSVVSDESDIFLHHMVSMSELPEASETKVENLAMTNSGIVKPVETPKTVAGFSAGFSQNPSAKPSITSPLPARYQPTASIPELNLDVLDHAGLRHESMRIDRDPNEHKTRFED